MTLLKGAQSVILLLLVLIDSVFLGNSVFFVPFVYQLLQMSQCAIDELTYVPLQT